jgi:hypothetical protein
MAPGAVTPAMIARSRTVAEPRWSPDGTWLAWIDAFGGRADLVVARADSISGGSGPPLVVTADEPLTPVGAYGGGAYAWAGDDTVVFAAADGTLRSIAATGGPSGRPRARPTAPSSPS